MVTHRDYAGKKRKTARPSSAKNKKPVKSKSKKFPLKLFLVVALVGAAVAYFFYILSQQPNSQPKAKTAIVSNKSTQAKTNAKKAEVKKRFEFYNMLPESKVDPSNAGAYKSTPKSVVAKQQYLLQTHSFRNKTDAEQERAKLLLLGFSNVFIVKTGTNSKTRYRVRTGPFKNRTDLSAAKNRLGRHNIFPLKIKAK